jgi:hypothetical protein
LLVPYVVGYRLRMAILNLEQPQWQYDTATKELVITFTEAMPDGVQDSANWKPTRKAVMRLDIPAGSQIIQIPQ